MAKLAHLRPNLVWETHDDGAFVTTPEELIADNDGYTPVIEAVKFLRRKTGARGFKWAGVCFGGGASDETFITVRLASTALPPERSLHRYCTFYTDIPSIARALEEEEAEVGRGEPAAEFGEGGGGGHQVGAHQAPEIDRDETQQRRRHQWKQQRKG